MRILLTGGTGFVGAALSARLAADGAQLVVLSRDAKRAASVLPAGTRIVGSLSELGNRGHFDAVINLAGEPIAAGRWTAARKRVLESSRITLTRELVAWMAGLEQKPRVLLSASAIGFYGDQQDNEVTEATRAHDEYQHRLCRDWEAAANGAGEFGVRTACLRIGLVLGPRGGFLARMLLPARFGLGGHIGSGQQWMSWIHREDLIEMFLFLLAREDLHGAFNATAPNPVRSREFAATLAAALRRPQLPAPALMFRIAFGEMSRLLLTGQRVLPARLQAAGFSFRWPTLPGALLDVLER